MAIKAVMAPKTMTVVENNQYATSLTFLSCSSDIRNSPLAGAKASNSARLLT
jgi:TPP-dependent pyruvate/acetoin dehydrogenase alpha subunit